MARKAKIKMKRGKIKIKFKSDDDILLHRHDGVQALLGAALSSAMRLPTSTPIAAEPEQLQRSVPTSVGPVEDPH